MGNVTIWVVFLHVLSAFTFVAAHGVSIFVAFRVRGEREPARIGALLDISAMALAAATWSALAILVTGIAAGWLIGSFSAIWPWVAIALLIGLGVVMTPLGANYFGALRKAVGQRTRRMKPTDPTPVPVSAAELAVLLNSRRPEQLLAVGGIGFLVILWLMVFKPF